MTCPHYQQFGFCTQYDCLFQHPSPYPPPHLTISTYQPPSLYQQYLSSPAASQPLSRPRRQQDRLMHANVQDFVGKLDELCKDQNGCRFLQKKIEDPEQLDFVFKEIHGHFNELMIDPFGNYICQKIIEYGNDEQRDDIVKTVANNLAKIALNVHGTRAVQKLIECFSTPEQIQTAVSALTPHVVTLIKDLNGNHVIQKCLHSLHTPHNQFIYDAVCQHCIEVASHKHGCCVLQRSFDYATVLQKDQLVYEISQHALVLVQDAFGNYVVQYVLELGVLSYSENIIRQFVNHVCLLSVQKFSSNVIENCIRTAQPKTRRLLIAELVNPTVMQHLLQDSFANYVIQTSLDFADSDQRAELVACIRPLLPTIRSTPYGKRIYSRIIKDSKSHFHQIM
ncbi:armadillo-type protein [Blakeslea trispora]|nr:armadillo-type protein [Blakeslea trispora]